MMLELGDDGVFKGVSEEELVYVDKNDLEELLNRYANLEKENEKLQTKNNAYLQDIEVFKEENTTLKLENEQLKQAYTQLKHRHSLLHDVCIDAECDRDSYQKDIASLEKENEELKQKVDFYKYFQKDARELEKENEQLKKEIKALDDTIDGLTETIFHYNITEDLK